MPEPNVLTGGCLCGAIRYEARGPFSPVSACHCGQCRRQSGHFIVSADVKRTNFALLQGAARLKWYRASPQAKRGFCNECGSVLFWDDGSDDFSINLGNFDQPTGLKVASHIFVDDKADYYDIDDDLPKFAGYDKPV